jgi:hypothetical protein
MPTKYQAPDAGRLAEIEARANAATRPPWQQIADGGIWDVGVGYIAEAFPVSWEAEDGAEIRWRTPADYEFVLHARTDIPWLLALARRLTEALRWTETNRTGPCLFCRAELFRVHADGCQLAALLRETAGGGGNDGF